MHERPRLLVASVGSLVGQNLLEGLAGRREGVEVVGFNSQADAVSNFLCDRVHLTPELNNAGFLARFEAIVAQEAPDLILPGRDDDVVFLAGWAERNPGVRCMVGGAASAQVLRDKRATAAFATARGLPFAPTLCDQDGWAAVSGLASGWGWPLVAKPRRGNASRGVVLATGESELRAALSWPDYCFQPWLGARPELAAWQRLREGGVPLDWSLPGVEKLSLDGCVAPSGRVLAPFATRHTQVRLGRTERVEALALDGELRPMLQAFGAALADLGWRGPFNVQLGRTPDGLLLAFEINGRFTGSAATLGHLGLDYIGECLGAFLEGAPLPGVRPATAQRVDKRLGNWALDLDAADTLRRAGVWER
ncbi:hypothetical protein [Pelomonas sp. Root1237]|uniref:hypothetical protein n=1 Tax=Pelomonas sp. Root1237 TaxID=1736434 RepID=UPI0006F23DEF|nr:hypothetical protein [Pelomonas sp. Root1237]KQV86824.1 hypothetical protein ASC91_19410 [Pelomonas sp. Root1237]